MVSDGDSKAFSGVEDVHGDVKVEKIDCVGHVQKRIGKHLLKLKASAKGKLDDATSTVLWSCYLAKCSNKTKSN
jgi:hypothetical protein